MAPLATRIHLSDPATASAKRTYIIYYITGNPGLIEYYRTFLTHLFGLLQQHLSSSSKSQSIDLQIYGRSLPGFETDGSVDLEKKYGKLPPYTVDEQIQFAENALKDFVRAAKEKGAQDVRVILMGHSLGTYMTMEIIRRLREEARVDPDGGIRVAGGVLLFATIMNLAGSPNGLKNGWFLRYPAFSQAVSVFAKVALFPIPTSVVSFFIGVGMGFPKEGPRVTAEFVKSRHGVRQALFMARDEMTEISTDKWDAEIWGAAQPSEHPHSRPVLRFLFAKADHWVADETRDQLIKAKGWVAGGVEEWKPKMEVDEKEGWVHAFCMDQSIPVAKRAFEYVQDILDKDSIAP